MEFVIGLVVIIVIFLNIGSKKDNNKNGQERLSGNTPPPVEKVNKCPECGKIIKEDTVYCENCGRLLK